VQISRGIYAQQAFLEQRSQSARERVSASLSEPGARPLVIGVSQLRNHCGGMEGKARNLERMLGAVDAAVGEGVQVLVFPEMFLPGYFVKEHGTPEEAAAAARALADQPGHSAFLDRLQEASRAAGMVLSFGFAEECDGCIHNSVGVIDADGAWLGVRRKNPLTVGPYDRVPFTERPASERSTVFRTRYAATGVCVCFDGEFPESVRRMRLDGAELLLWSNAATGNAKVGSSTRFNQCGSYAQTNRMWVASCNAVCGSFYGNSCIYAPWGEPLVQLPHDSEALGVATINLSLGSDWAAWRDQLDFSGLVAPEGGR